MLANLWEDTQEAGGVLNKVIVGNVPCFDGEWHDCIDEAGVIIDSVARPGWLNEDHPDLDDRTQW